MILRSEGRAKCCFRKLHGSNELFGCETCVYKADLTLLALYDISQYNRHSTSCFTSRRVDHKHIVSTVTLTSTLNSRLCYVLLYFEKKQSHMSFVLCVTELLITVSCVLLKFLYHFYRSISNINQVQCE